MIKVSIVVPVYNLENYLPRCLDALVNQTLEDIEILCVDDGSKDSAPQIIEDYKAKYPNKVKTFHKENGGEWSARTFGLKHATGEYIGFIDSDDVPEITWAEKLYKAAKENNADIAFSGYDRVDMDTGKTVSIEMNKLGRINKDVDWNDDFILYANPSLWNKLYRRELVKDSEFLPFRGANDTLFLIRSYMDGAKKLTFIPDVLYHYYLRSSSQIHNMNENDIANLKKYFLVLKEYCIKIGKYEEYKETFASMVFVHMGISWAFMLSYDKTVKMSKAMREITEYLNENFPEWKKSKHFKLTHCLPKGLKHLAIWGVHFFYRIHLPVVYIWVNRFIRDVLKIEVKW